MANEQGYSLIVSARAHKEIIGSHDWYEERQQGLGQRFMDELVHKLRQIESNPEQYSVKYRQYREVLVSVFPVVIIYRIHKKKRSIYVVSVFHTSRDHRTKY